MNTENIWVLEATVVEKDWLLRSLSGDFHYKIVNTESVVKEKEQELRKLTSLLSVREASQPELEVLRKELNEKNEWRKKEIDLQQENIKMHKQALEEDLLVLERMNQQLAKG